MFVFFLILGSKWQKHCEFRTGASRLFMLFPCLSEAKIPAWRTLSFTATMTEHHLIFIHNLIQSDCIAFFIDPFFVFLETCVNHEALFTMWGTARTSPCRCKVLIFVWISCRVLPSCKDNEVEKEGAIAAAFQFRVSWLQPRCSQISNYHMHEPGLLWILSSEHITFSNGTIHRIMPNHATHITYLTSLEVVIWRMTHDNAPGRSQTLGLYALCATSFYNSFTIFYRMFTLLHKAPNAFILPTDRSSCMGPGTFDFVDLDHVGLLACRTLST